MGCCLMTKSLAYGALLHPLLHHGAFSQWCGIAAPFLCAYLWCPQFCGICFRCTCMRKDFFMQSKQKNYLTIVISVAFLIALDVILTRFLSIQTQFLRIGFGFLPIAIAGILYGPFWGIVCGAVGDILGMIIYPSGAFFPGFTLTAALTGAVFGWILYNRKISVLRILAASAIVCIGLNLLLDTLWLDLMYGSGYFVLLPARIVKCVLNIPIYTVLIALIWGKGLSRIPAFRTAGDA